MEVKGVGQKIPKPEPEPAAASHFEEVFDESRKKMEETKGAGGEDPKLLDTINDDFAVASLSSPYLNNNNLFNSLKEWMGAFHKELHDKEVNDDSPEASADCYLRINLYECLKKLLREIVLTKDRNLQMQFLQRVYDWFAKRQRDTKRPSTIRREVGVLSPRSQGLVHSQKNPFGELSAKKMYEQKMRTLHPEIPPPKERLGEFQRRGLNKSYVQIATDTSANTNNDNTTADAAGEGIEKNDKSFEEGKGKDGVIPSPPLIPQKMWIGGEWARRERKAAAIEAKSTFLYYNPREPEEQKVERMWFARKNKAVAEKRVEEELKEAVKKWGNAKARINENLVRKYENVNYANNFPVRSTPIRQSVKLPGLNKTDIDYKEIYEKNSSGDEAEDSRPATEESPVQSPIERTPLPKLRKSRPEIADLRDSQSVLPVPSHSTNPNPHPPPRSTSVAPNAMKAIYEGDKKKVDYIRKMYGKMIDASEDKMDTAANIFVNGPKGMKSLSIYNKDVKRSSTVDKRHKVATRSVPATHVGNREMFRVQQIKEINKIKSHLAREDIQCDVMALQRAILMPEDYPSCMMQAENFPRPGSRLLVNPFAVKKKRGKKKKGKGKGRK